MLAWGKVRKIDESTSRVQTLIGRAGEGDQVIEFAKIGLHVSFFAGVTAFETDGFDEVGDFYFNLFNSEIGATLPEDSKAPRAQIGLSAEYNLAWILGISELYAVVEGSWIPVPGMLAWQGMGGVRKKWYFRRLGVYGTLKFGGIGVEFLDTDIFDDEEVEDESDGVAYGVGADIGMEVLLSPQWWVRAQVSAQGFPEQTVLLVIDNNGDLRDGRIAAAGLAYTVTLGYTF
jgi:hypothetical protein